MFKVTFKTDNAAFTSFADSNLEWETEKILLDLIAKIHSGRAGGTIQDSNGNTIGEWELS